MSKKGLIVGIFFNSDFNQDSIPFKLLGSKLIIYPFKANKKFGSKLLNSADIVR